MTLTGIIERYQFAPVVYYQQSKLICWVRTIPDARTVILEDVGTPAELAKKYELSSVNSQSLSAILGRKCRISITRGMNRFKKFLE